jgi:hypothetical protein
MKTYKRGGVSGKPDDIQPLNPQPARQLPTERPQLRERSVMEKLTPYMEAKMNLERAPSRLSSVSYDDVVNYLAKKYNMTPEESRAKLPDEVKAYIFPTRPGMAAGYTTPPERADSQGYYGSSNTMSGGFLGRQDRLRKERGSLVPRKYINLSPEGSEMPLLRSEERIHSMQQNGIPITGEAGFNKTLRQLRRGYEQMGVDTSGQEWDYYFDPLEMEAKVMGAKMAMQEAGVIGEGPITDEDLDNMYLFAQDQYRGSDIESKDIMSILGLLGIPGRQFLDNPEYRSAMLDLMNRY